VRLAWLLLAALAINYFDRWVWGIYRRANGMHIFIHSLVFY
jgi:hypothetical protein